MASELGWNFRSTLAYVTDPAGTVFVATSADYPQITNGITWGWNGLAGRPFSARDRSTSVDARLAGQHHADNNAAAEFLIDLAGFDNTGGWEIRAAFGDAAFAAIAPARYALYDDLSLIAEYTTNPPAGDFVDATGVTRTSAADWVTNNAALSHTFSGSQLRLEFGDTSNASLNSVVAHLHLKRLAAGGGTTVSRMMLLGVGA